MRSPIPREPEQTVPTAWYGADHLGSGVGEFGESFYVNRGKAGEEYVRALAAGPD